METEANGNGASMTAKVSHAADARRPSFESSKAGVRRTFAASVSGGKTWRPLLPLLASRSHAIYGVEYTATDALARLNGLARTLKRPRRISHRLTHALKLRGYAKTRNESCVIELHQREFVLLDTCYRKADYGV